MDTAASPDMQTIVQVNIYRLNYDTPEFLLLRHINDDDRSWQPVSQRVGSDGAIADAIKQALKQQAGLDGFKKLSSEMYTYEWYAHGEQGRDIVFAAEVAMETAITIDTSQFSDFRWLAYGEAVERLKWQGNKEALRRLRDHIIAERLHNPPPKPAHDGQSPNVPVPAVPEAAAPLGGWPGQYAAESRPEPYLQPELQANVIPLPVYEGPDAPPPPPNESIPGNQQAPDIPLPPQPDTPNYHFTPRTSDNNQ